MWFSRLEDCAYPDGFCRPRCAMMMSVQATHCVPRHSTKTRYQNQPGEVRYDHCRCEPRDPDRGKLGHSAQQEQQRHLHDECYLLAHLVFSRRAGPCSLSEERADRSADRKSTRLNSSHVSISY